MKKFKIIKGKKIGSVKVNGKNMFNIPEHFFKFDVLTGNTIKEINPNHHEFISLSNGETYVTIGIKSTASGIKVIFAKKIEMLKSLEDEMYQIEAGLSILKTEIEYVEEQKEE